MPDVPAPCQPFQDRIGELESEIAALEDDIAGKNLPPNEPRPSPSQKEILGRQIDKLRADQRTAQRDLQACVDANTPPAPADTTPQLRVTNIMVTQSIQTLDNRVRLIRNRRTGVRVFVVSGVTNGFNAGAGPNRWPNVTGDLRVTDPDTGFSTGAIQPFNAGGAITAMPVTQLNADNANHSLNFRLPLSAMSARRLELTARVWVSGHDTDPGGWTTQQTTSVDLNDRTPQEVTPLLIIDTVAGLPPPPFATFVSMLRRGALARLPVPFFNVNPPITVPVGNDLTTVVGWAQMMASLTTISFIGRRSGGIRTGLVPYPSSGLRPVGGMGLPRIAFTVPAFVSEPNENTFAHEMGHTHGLNHAVCSGTEPWLHDSRLPGHTDEIGMHVEDGVVLPRGSTELMSYCPDPGWPSRATYDLIYDNPA